MADGRLLLVLIEEQVQAGAGRLRPPGRGGLDGAVTSIYTRAFFLGGTVQMFGWFSAAAARAS